MRTDPIAINAELKRRESIKETLLMMCPDLADDDQALIDTLDGETNIKEMLALLARSAKEREAAESAAKAVAQVYQERAKRHKAAQEALKKTIIAAMLQLGEKTIKHPLVTLTYRKLDDKIEIVDKEPALAPEEFTRTRTIVEFDLSKIEANIDEAVEMGIAIIHSDRHSVTIRI